MGGENDVPAKDGQTSPGQSHNRTVEFQKMVCESETSGPVNEPSRKAKAHLERLGLAWCPRSAHDLATEKRVKKTRFADVWLSYA